MRLHRFFGNSPNLIVSIIKVHFSEMIRQDGHAPSVMVKPLNPLNVGRRAGDPLLNRLKQVGHECRDFFLNYFSHFFSSLTRSRNFEALFMVVLIGE